MINGVVEACGNNDSAAETVGYSTAVRVPLRGLSSGVKRRIWRDRQIQTQAYNWGVEYALRAHYRGERIPSPRNHSAPLTQFRHETGSTHSLLLQRGGFWGAVDAVKKWSKRRNQLVYAQRKATEGTDKALGVQGAFLDGFASGSPDCGGAAMSVQVRAMRESLAQHRGDRRRRIELVESGADSALHLWPTQPSPALSGMPADERAEMIAKATDGSDKALESFNAALKALSAAINSVDCTKAERKRLRGLADKARSAAAAEAKADKRLLAHVDKADKRLFRTRSDTERCSGPALVLFEGCTIRDGGVLRLPGGTEIPLPDGIETIDDVLASPSGREPGLGRSGAYRGRDRHSGQGHPPHHPRASQVPRALPVPRLRSRPEATDLARTLVGHRLGRGRAAGVQRRFRLRPTRIARAAAGQPASATPKRSGCSSR